MPPSAPPPQVTGTHTHTHCCVKLSSDTSPSTLSCWITPYIWVSMHEHQCVRVCVCAKGIRKCHSYKRFALLAHTADTPTCKRQCDTHTAFTVPHTRTRACACHSKLGGCVCVAWKDKQDTHTVLLSSLCSHAPLSLLMDTFVNLPHSICHISFFQHHGLTSHSITKP